MPCVMNRTNLFRKPSLNRLPTRVAFKFSRLFSSDPYAPCKRRNPPLPSPQHDGNEFCCLFACSIRFPPARTCRCPLCPSAPRHQGSRLVDLGVRNLVGCDGAWTCSGGNDFVCRYHGLGASGCPAPFYQPFLVRRA